MWKPDGLGWRARIGLVVPHVDIVPECEMWTMAPPGVSIHCNRIHLEVERSDPRAKVPAEALRSLADPPQLDHAVAMLAGAPLHAIVFGFTSAGYALGPEGDEALRQRLEQRSGSVPVVLCCEAAVHALRSLHAERVALVDPPWFPDEVTRMGADYFRRAGLEVSYAAPAEIAAGPLPQGQRDITPERLYEWVRQVVPPRAQAVFLGGNGFRSAGALDALEQTLGRAVLSANGVCLWLALRRAGVRDGPTGYGRLFSTPLR